MSNTETAGIKVYQTTKEACQKIIDIHKSVCSCCGGKLSPIETVDNSDNPTYWSGCMECNRFDWGVSPITHEIAKELVLNKNYIHYHHLGVPYDRTGEDLKYWQQSQISGACNIVDSIIDIYESKKEKP